MSRPLLFTSAFVLTASLLAGNAAFAAGSDPARNTPWPYMAVKDGDWDEPRPRFDAARDRIAPSLASTGPVAVRGAHRNCRAVQPGEYTATKEGDWDEPAPLFEGSGLCIVNDVAPAGPGVAQGFDAEPPFASAARR